MFLLESRQLFRHGFRAVHQASFLPENHLVNPQTNRVVNRLSNLLVDPLVIRQLFLRVNHRVFQVRNRLHSQHLFLAVHPVSRQVVRQVVNRLDSP
jgi:hypothetical protein